MWIKRSIGYGYTKMEKFEEVWVAGNRIMAGNARHPYAVIATYESEERAQEAMKSLENFITKTAGFIDFSFKEDERLAEEIE